MNSGVRRVMILGHSGFVGSRIVRRLREHSPGIEVVGRSDPQRDLTDPAESKRLAAELDNTTALVICAGVKRQLGDTPDTFERNMAIVTNIARAVERSSVRRVIYFSSAAVYSEEIDQAGINEATPVNPTSYYGIAKYASERVLAKALGDRAAEGLAILRPALIYGPGDMAAYGPSGFVRQAVREGKVTLWGDGTELREFVFVDDVAYIVQRLIDNGCSGPLNIVTGESHRFTDILDTLHGLLGRVIETDSRPRSRTKVDNQFDNRRLLEAVPDVVFTPLAAGIRQTLAAEQALPRG